MFFEMLYFVESFVRFYNIRLLQCPLILAGVGLKLTLGYGSLTSGCQLKNRQPCPPVSRQPFELGLLLCGGEADRVGADGGVF